MTNNKLISTVVTKETLDELTEQAKLSTRLRMNKDMRTSSDDQSQRMLNALEPGTIVPIHRHTKSTETVSVLRGKVCQNFYDEHGVLLESLIVEAGGSCPFFVVPLGIWHNTESLETGTIIFESKDGAYESLRIEDVME